MKKIVCLALAVFMMLSLCACGAKKDTLVVGITDFAPMDYKNVKGEWIGFDADMAKEFAKFLGKEVEFVEIDWDNKIMELDAGTIDCVWNGMTLTDEVKKGMECSNPYCNNAQVVVIPADKAAAYQDEASLKDLVFAVEAGSAAATSLGEVIATHVIPRPHQDVEKLLPAIK